MTLRRVTAPVDDEVGSVLHLAQCTRHLAPQLGGYLSGTVSEGGVAVDHPTDQLGDGDRLPLGLARDVAEAVDQGQVGIIEVTGRRLDGCVERGGLAVDEGVREQPLRGVVLEPGITQAAGILALDDAVPFGVQLDVVAHAAAEGAGRVLHYGEAHAGFSSGPSSRPEPGGTTKVQPSSRPGKLPRVRRG